jgi:hypothetical protein
MLSLKTFCDNPFLTFYSYSCAALQLLPNKEDYMLNSPGLKKGQVKKGRIGNQVALSTVVPA